MPRVKTQKAIKRKVMKTVEVEEVVEPEVWGYACDYCGAITIEKRAISDMIAITYHIADSDAIWQYFDSDVCLAKYLANLYKEDCIMRDENPYRTITFHMYDLPDTFGAFNHFITEYNEALDQIRSGLVLRKVK